MHILYLTNGFPYPLTSGYLRHYFLIRELARHHAITLLALVAPDLAPEHLRELAPYTQRVLTFASAERNRPRSQKALLRMRRLSAGEWLDPAVAQMGAALRRLLREHPGAVVLFSGKETFGALAGRPPDRLIVDLCDAASLRVRGQMLCADPLQRLRLAVTYVRLRRVEQALIRQASHLLFASGRDRDALLKAATDRVTLVPNGVDLAYWQRRSPELGRHTIAFTGAMDYPPNTDAALYLLTEIFPRVREIWRAARLLIVGRDPPAHLRRAAGQPGVTLTGYVDDVRPYLEQASLLAAPLRFGAGIQNKVLEALAMELPVVASPVAADGLRTEAGDCPPLEVAHNAAEFAHRLASRLKAVSQRPVPHAEGRRYVASHFGWARSGEKLLQVIAQVGGQ